MIKSLNRPLNAIKGANKDDKILDQKYSRERENVSAVYGRNVSMRVGDT